MAGCSPDTTIFWYPSDRRRNTRMRTAWERRWNICRRRSEPNSSAFEDHYATKGLLHSDPPDHTRLRALVTREFTVMIVEKMRPRIQEVVDGLLDAAEKTAEWMWFQTWRLLCRFSDAEILGRATSGSVPD